MEVLRVMDSNENWREMLSNEPYNIIIKDYDEMKVCEISLIENFVRRNQ